MPPPMPVSQPGIRHSAPGITPIALSMRGSRFRSGQAGTCCS